MKYYIIAGEASGDLHGANLIKALRQQDKEADFRCWGGDLMQAASQQTLVKHYRDLSFMGFVEVVKNLRTIWRNLKLCEQDLLSYQPDVLILIDYPGFNLRIAQFAHQQDFKVFYYISPQVWAWHSSRVKKMKKIIDRMFVILPFEKDFYEKDWQWKVDFVGHPLLDALVERQTALYQVNLQALQSTQQLDERPIIALLPGSRKQEIKRILPLMLPLAAFFADYQFVIAGAPSIAIDFYKNIMKKTGIYLAVVPNKTYELLALSNAALVGSGTATLETALLNVPQVVCYRGNSWSFQLAKRLVNQRVKYISLVNLILDKEAVQELIQGDMTVQNLIGALREILPPSRQRAQILEDYHLLRKKLGGVGASERTAKLMYSILYVKDAENPL